ncbi:hypothetical protein N6H14_21205 [Paenibacillus sp. CC-CFT747]|nr:hypothetical protein N6H14_21205 [Paenibacillus sp. CC-CFT747]
MISEARNRGFAFWTAEQINRWYRSRREMSARIGQDGQLSTFGAIQPDAVIWIPLAPDQAAIAAERVFSRFGVPCLKRVAADLPQTEESQTTKTQNVS